MNEPKHKPETFSDTAPLSEAARLVAQNLKRPSLSPFAVTLLAMWADIISVSLAIWFADFIAGGGDIAPVRTAVAAFLVSGLGAALLARLHRYRPVPLTGFVTGSGSVAAIAMVGAFLVSFTGAWSSPATMFISVLPVTLLATVLPSRLITSSVARWVRDFGLTERRAVIVGGGLNAATLIRGLADRPDNDIRICGIFDDRDESRSPPVVVGVPKIGSVDDLVGFSREAEIDMLIVTLPLSAEKRIREILDKVRVLPLDVRLSPHSSDLAFRRRKIAPESGNGLISVLSRPIDGGQRIVKRTLDFSGALVALAILSPVLVLTAIAIRVESRGPVFFTQMRHGYNHKPIEVLKFRSMFHENCDETARQLVTRNDPRVTKVGRFIRKWSIDELPQLINVLRGDLSLVGPRPHALNAVSSRRQAFEQIVEGYAARHRVLPGVTGWAQIHGWRGEIDNPESLRQRVEHDLYYIENHSIWMDIKVLLRTPLCLLNTSNAY